MREREMGVSVSLFYTHTHTHTHTHTQHTKNTVELATLFPSKCMLGLEIRVKVSDYVKDRIAALRR